MAAESSFDIVSKVNRQEVDNALNQAAKEVRQRFDFKNTDASIRWSGQAIEMEANSEERVKAVLAEIGRARQSSARRLRVQARQTRR